MKRNDIVNTINIFLALIALYFIASGGIFENGNILFGILLVVTVVTQFKD